MVNDDADRGSGWRVAVLLNEEELAAGHEGVGDIGHRLVAAVQLHRAGEWSPEREDFTWLETAFCDEFLKQLSWFGGMDHEWRSGPKAGQGGFWVLLWSKDPQRLWWELRDEFERQCALDFLSPPVPLAARPLAL